MQNSPRQEVCVIGAGIIGLSTAVNILKSIPDVNVTVISEKFTPHTTGDLSAGYWKPYQITGTEDIKLMKWGKETWDHLMHLSNQPNARTLGVHTISGYQLFDTQLPAKEYQYIHTRFSEMTQAEMALYGKDHLSGVFFTTIICECVSYLPWLTKRLKQKGGNIIQKKILSLEDSMLKDFDVVVNCAGIGAREIVGDNDLGPIRGQVIKVRAPWVKHFYLSDNKLSHYVIPGIDLVTLGGTANKGDWNGVPTEADKQAILEGCYKLVPSLKEAEIVGDFCGLRPHRSKGVRLEKEIVHINGAPKPIVHNYGHGGSGVTLHWGCAREATELVKQCVQLYKSKL